MDNQTHQSDPHDIPLNDQSYGQQSPGQVLLEWRAPSRFFQKRTRQYFTTVFAIVFLVSVILLLLQEYAAIGAIFALVFLVYAFSTVPPEEVEHRITTFGIETAGRRYIWIELVEFWFEEKLGQHLLIIHTRLPFPSRLHILLGSVDREKTKQILSPYLPFRKEPLKTAIDRAAEWVTRKIPLETTT